jgi:hypothetical protein
MDRGRFLLRRASAVLVASGLVFLVFACSKDAEPPPEARGSGDAGDSETKTSASDAIPEHNLGPMVECEFGTAVETEPNDTPETANVFTELAFCGVLSTPSDVDYFTFDTPPSTKLTVFQGVIQGMVEFELMQNGATFGPADTDMFGSGKVLVKAFTRAGKPASYRVRLQFDPI